MRAYVTGGHGFVGGWLERHLVECGDEVLVTDTGVDVTDAQAIARSVAEFQPDAIYHLAGLANVAASWSDPTSFWNVNATGTLNVLEAARACDRVPTVLIVASAEVYGTVSPDELPITEQSPLRPASPYAVSKVAADFLGLQAWIGHKVPTVRARAFNHVGPGQAGSFLVTDVARQVARLVKEGGDTLKVGNLSSRRDFTDVRDVVRAYRLMVERGEPGESYNVCTGRDVLVEDVVRRLMDLGGIKNGRLEVDPSLLRPVDIPVLKGDPSKLAAATGWSPTYDLDQTLSDVLAQFLA